MNNQKKLELQDFPISKVSLAKNEAYISRIGNLKLKSNSNSFLLESMTKKLKPVSLRIVILENSDKITLENHILQSNKKKKEISDESKEFYTKITELNNKIDIINNSISKEQLKFNHINGLLKATKIPFFKSLVEPKQEEKERKDIDRLRNFFNDFKTELNQTNGTLNSLNHELKLANHEKTQIQKEISKIELKNNKNKIVDFSYFFSLNTQADVETKIEITYIVPSSWKPVYDLKIYSNSKLKVSYWIIAENLSNEDWLAIDLCVLYKKHLATKVELPQPIPIRDNIMNLLDKKFEKFKKEHEFGQTSEAVTLQGKKLDIPADKESHAYLIHEFESDFTMSYYWNAAETDYIVIGTEFKNSDIDLLGGYCNFFKNDEIFSRGRLPEIIKSNQKVKLPMAIDSSIVVNKRLMKQKKVKKKQLNMEYRLQLINNSTDEKKIKIIDVLPQSSHPRSKISLINCSIEANTENQGLIEWNINLKTEFVITYTIEVKG